MTTDDHHNIATLAVIELQLCSNNFMVVELGGIGYGPLPPGNAKE